MRQLDRYSLPNTFNCLCDIMYFDYFHDPNFLSKIIGLKSVRVLISSNDEAWLPLIWKTWKIQGIGKRPLKVREFATDFKKSGNFVV